MNRKLMAEQPKNIVIIGPAYPLRGGGMATFNERLARELMALGHTVTIYTFSLQYPSFLFPGTSQLSTEAAPKGLDIRVAINSVWPLNWLRVGREIRNRKPDLVIVRYWLPFMGPCLGTILRVVRQNRHTEIVCIADNILPHEKRPGDLPFTRYFIKPVHRFIVMSRSVLADLKKLAPAKPVSLVHHPLYDNFGDRVPMCRARQELNLSQEAYVLLFFGFVRKYKGLDLLLEAMPAIVQQVPNALLVVAGEFYEDEKPYRQIIERLGLQERVILKNNFISDAEVPLLFGAADLVVQPYRSATQSGVTPLAYHFEVPMVVTNVGGLPEMVPHAAAGWVCEPDPGSIANAVIGMHALPAAQFTDGIARQKKLLSWEAFCTALLG